MSQSNITLVRNPNTNSIKSTATALAANAGRVRLFVQNCGQNPLFVKYGSGASATDFDVILAAGTANDNGTGGSDSWEGSTCPSSIVTTAGTAPRYIASEYTEVPQA
jgi:hypothetical protein